MVFKVQCVDHHWRVVHPMLPAPVEFDEGSVAFDFADDLARAQHARTGEGSVVRVEVMDVGLEAVRYGRDEVK